MSVDDKASGTLDLAGRTVRRLGFGAMRVSAARNADGRRDRSEAVELYRRTYDLGINFIDVANIYGYGECEAILAEALHPYPDDPIPGTSDIEHLEDNVGAVSVQLSDSDLARIDALREG